MQCNYKVVQLFFPRSTLICFDIKIFSTHINLYTHTYIYIYFVSSCGVKMSSSRLSVDFKKMKRNNRGTQKAIRSQKAAKKKTESYVNKKCFTWILHWSLKLTKCKLTLHSVSVSRACEKGSNWSDSGWVWHLSTVVASGDKVAQTNVALKIWPSCAHAQSSEKHLHHGRNLLQF